METDSPSHARKHTWQIIILCLLGMMVIITLAVRFAEPLKDGDLWWQMAYGRYLIENRTLILDHTIFSWTPAAGGHIYCAWFAEAFLYLLYQAGGLPILFALRYVCLLVFIVLVLLYAKKQNVATHPLVWLVCLLGLLMSQTGAFIKPEIFSYTLMTLTVWTWWQIKTSGNRARLYCYLLPCLLLVWVNSHGGFVFGAVFLGLIGLGEIINILCSSEEALAPNIRRHFFIALVLSALVLFITPYGYHYPAQLVLGVLRQGEVGAGGVMGYKTIYAFRSIFHPRAQLFHYVDYLLIAGSILLLLLWQKRRIRQWDWSLLITNLAFGWFYTWYLRSTYYWAPVFAFSAIHLLSHRPAWLWPERKHAKLLLHGAVLLIAVFIGGRACFDAVCKPFPKRWCGFGYGYQNPVEEADFIRTHFAGYRLGNDYGSGGYLLWALWPETKVFIDPRYFPYRSWYMEYLQFFSGRNVSRFMKKYPCDVWCVSLKATRLLYRISRSPEWKLAFYGPSAAVFIRKDLRIPDDSKKVGDGVANIKNLEQAVRVLYFAGIVGDSQTAKTVMDRMDSRFRCPNQKRRVERIRSFVRKRFGG